MRGKLPYFLLERCFRKDSILFLDLSPWRKI